MIKKHVFPLLLIAGFISGCATRPDIIYIPDIDLIPKSDAVKFLQSFHMVTGGMLGKPCGKNFDSENFVVPPIQLELFFGSVVKKYTDLQVISDVRHGWPANLPTGSIIIRIDTKDSPPYTHSCVFAIVRSEIERNKIISAFVSLGAKARKF